MARRRLWCALLLTQPVPADAAPPVQLRFTFTAARVQQSTVQLSRIDLFTADGDAVVVSVASNPGGSNADSANQGAHRLTDGDASTKWLDSSFAANSYRSVVLLTPSGTFDSIASYQMHTAFDVTKRDPVAWTIEAHTICGEWVMLASVAMTPPTTREAAYQPSLFPLAQTADVAVCPSPPPPLAPPPPGIPAHLVSPPPSPPPLPPPSPPPRPPLPPQAPAPPSAPHSDTYYFNFTEA